MEKEERWQAARSWLPAMLINWIMGYLFNCEQFCFSANSSLLLLYTLIYRLELVARQFLSLCTDAYFLFFVSGIILCLHTLECLAGSKVSMKQCKLHHLWTRAGSVENQWKHSAHFKCWKHACEKKHKFNQHVMLLSYNQLVNEIVTVITIT